MFIDILWMHSCLVEVLLQKIIEINIFLDDEKSSEKAVNSRVLNQLKVIHEKISELERMRLYLRVTYLYDYICL
jgi:hypothetical protein